MKTMTLTRICSFSVALTVALAIALVVSTNPAFAITQDWQLGFQDAATPVAERLHSFHNFLLIIITGIVAFVTVLLLYVVIRFRAKANPNPSMTTHNVPLEIIWTVVPVLILIAIAIPSFKLLYYMDRTENPEMTLKVTGYQWYWGFEYPDHGDISVTSNMIKDADIDTSKGQIRLLSTDNPIVLPVETNIQVIVTAADVLHSFAMPAFGIKTDAVPGRINETWIRIKADQVGKVFYGQCSELCGQGHAFMPVEIIAVSKEDFAAWVEKQGGTMPEAKVTETSATPVTLGSTVEAPAADQPAE
jgi:cytochrome c oxidase subunit 2